MASSLLAGRGGGHHHNWGETRAPLEPIPPNPSPSQPHPRADGSKSKPRAAAGYVKFRPASLGHREARALRDRLAVELGQVRALLSRIDTWQQQGPPPRAVLRGAMRKRCGQILSRLRKDKRSVWFNAPVEVERLGLHDYHAVIKRPMDLGTVKEGLAAGRYASHDDFAADVRLTFTNALRYNPVGHEVHTFAGALLAYFERMYKEALVCLEEERKRLEPPRPVAAELPPPPAVEPVEAKAKTRAGNVRMRKPKAREPNKREMSLEEKNMLRLGLVSLPEEKMHNVLQIVRKRNNNPEMLGDEIELDIDEMDVETQWELDRFVTNFNKALKKSQRAAMLNGGVADVTSTAVAEDDTAPVGDVPTLVGNDDAESEEPVKSTTVAEQVDEYVDIGDEMPAATYQSMEIEKDAEGTTGSGGSGSGSSSSSGSESRSSGDSASGAGNAHSLT
ncbi:bromodomain containing protein [Zea mays]|uniref:Transcription factor GTE7 n=1 Tax=Zea mays TaxID=4577 RepID=A0A804RIX3_MAIZE|nr:bromodomain containing protein [Zea mays]|eukprot:NP_001151218.2 bromodomain containing protein [Zea mays]